MPAARRSTIYFDPTVHRALRLHSAATDRNLSDLVNDMVRRALEADQDDLAAAPRYTQEPSTMRQLS